MSGILGDDPYPDAKPERSSLRPSAEPKSPTYPWQRLRWPWEQGQTAPFKSKGGAPQKPLLAPLYDTLKSVMGSRRAREVIAETLWPDDLKGAGPENVKKRIQRERKRVYGILSKIPKIFFFDD